MLNEVSKTEMMKTINWLTQNTPYRLAGSQDEHMASEYITNRMKEYGLEVVNEEFRTYNSDPLCSEVEILSPELIKIDSLPCAHIKSTSPEGDVFELVYVGNGDAASYKDLDVKGKIVLVEVTYAPPVPEKARIAEQMGAAGIMCMNWGNDEEVICCRALKSVWGNPTEATLKNIPDIIGVGITRTAGLQLKAMLLDRKKVLARIKAIATRQWSIVHQPKGILRALGEDRDFLLVCSHLDAWKPGVTCNATGNATALEICRILSQHRNELKKDIYFIFWDGHEIAEAAGSTWFLDNNWDIVNKHCIGYIHIDSTGVRETELFEIKASDEMLDFAKDNASEILPNIELRAMSLKKIGDQSYMGIGVPSVTQRMSFTKEYMEHAHGATLGWWNHTKEDGLDKCDPGILEKDTKVTLQLIYNWINAPTLPYAFEQKLNAFEVKAQELASKYHDHFIMDDLIANIATSKAAIMRVCDKKNILGCENFDTYNSFIKMVSRLTTDIMMTYTDKYSQDSYGFTKLSAPIPLLADITRLENLDPTSFEYGLIKTQLVKNKNRICDALARAEKLAMLYGELLESK